MNFKNFRTATVILLALMLLSPVTGCDSVSADSTTKEVNNADAGTANRNDAESEKVNVTFVELGSENCIPCRMMKPVMEKIEQQYKDQVKVVFHDVWTPEGRVSGVKYAIRVIPTQVFLDKDGKEYYRHEGFFPFEEVDKILKQKGVK